MKETKKTLKIYIYIKKIYKKNIWGNCGVLGPRTAFS